MAVAELVRLLVIGFAADEDADQRRMVCENTVDQPCLGHVHDLIDPELTYTGLCPVESGDIAVDIPIIAQENNFAAFFTQEAGLARGLHCNHLCVRRVECEVNCGTHTPTRTRTHTALADDRVEWQHANGV